MTERQIVTGRRSGKNALMRTIIQQGHHEPPTFEGEREVRELLTEAVLSGNPPLLPEAQAVARCKGFILDHISVDYDTLQHRGFGGGVTEFQGGPTVRIELTPIRTSTCRLCLGPSNVHGGVCGACAIMKAPEEKAELKASELRPAPSAGRRHARTGRRA